MRIALYSAILLSLASTSKRYGPFKSRHRQIFSSRSTQERPYGVNAIVTADLDLDQRLRNIRDNVKAGRPITGFAEQMADIMGRAMPQLPRDIRNPQDNTGPNDANQAGNPNP